MHMTSMTVHLRSIPDTQAALGWTEGHTIVVDRPDGKAGGMGLGFNGGQLRFRGPMKRREFISLGSCRQRGGDGLCACATGRADAAWGPVD